jgi:DNA-binding NarL/FixJ family response regulator
MRPTTVIADSQRLFAEGLRSLLQAEYETLAIAANGRQLIELVLHHRPELVLTDVWMPHLNGLDAMLLLRRAGLTSRFVALTVSTDVGLAAGAFRAGASAYLSKSAASEELKQALGKALCGCSYLSPCFPFDMKRVLAEGTRGPQSTAAPRLTLRQREVLQLVAEGRTMKEAAAELRISARTAYAHKYQLMDLLGIHTSAELVQYAIRIGLINVEGAWHAA